MHIDKNSRGTVAMIYLISAAAIFAVFKYSNSFWVIIPVTLLFLFFAIWQTAFHIVPRRPSEGSDHVVSAVSDGKVVRIEKVFEPDVLKKECLQISVYMDFWDVHANFWPVTGEVTYTTYNKGKHLLAFKPKASSDNEHTCTCIRTSDGKDVYFKQIAGTFARRIVNYAQPGMKVDAAKQCGIIKFGSRIDMFLPSDADVKVKEGDLIRACETVIAEI